MGKARSYEIIEYRKKIMELICKSEELLKLLGEEKSPRPTKTIPYIKCFPHEYIPETIDSTDRYLNFDIRATLDHKNNVYKDLTIFFFITCHQDVVRYKDDNGEYLWYDKVTCELDNMFGDKNVLGVGEMSLESNAPYCPINVFKGRMLRFTVKDFTNGLRYGK